MRRHLRPRIWHHFSVVQRRHDLRKFEWYINGYTSRGWGSSSNLELESNDASVTGVDGDGQYVTFRELLGSKC